MEFKIGQLVSVGPRDCGEYSFAPSWAGMIGIIVEHQKYERYQDEYCVYIIARQERFWLHEKNVAEVQNNGV